MSIYLGDKLISGTGVPDDITVSSITPLIELGPERTESWTTMLFSGPPSNNLQSWTVDSVNRVFVGMALDSPTTQIIADAVAVGDAGGSIGLNYDPTNNAFTGFSARTWIPTVFTLTAGGSTFTFDFAIFNAITEGFNDIRFEYVPGGGFSIITVDDETGGAITPELITWLNTNAVATNVTVSFTYRTREIGVQTIDIPSLPTVAQTGDGIWNNDGLINIGAGGLTGLSDVAASEASDRLPFDVSITSNVFSDVGRTAQTFAINFDNEMIYFEDDVVTVDTVLTVFRSIARGGESNWEITDITFTAGGSTFNVDIAGILASGTPDIAWIGTNNGFQLRGDSTGSITNWIAWLNANVVGAIDVTMQIQGTTVNSESNLSRIHSDRNISFPTDIGILFDSTTTPVEVLSDANLLTFYESASWTPISTTVGAEIISFAGVPAYVKVGDVVTAEAFVRFGTITITSNAFIDGLPFSNVSQVVASLGIATSAITSGGITTRTTYRVTLLGTQLFFADNTTNASVPFNELSRVSLSLSITYLS